MRPPEGAENGPRSDRSEGQGLRRGLVIPAILVVLTLGACKAREVDPTPERLDGTASMEFEADDIERAESASAAVEEYCRGASSEAQYVGCLSHVSEDDLP
jgi:hypothetical protein